MSMKMPGSAAQLMRMPRRATMACSSQMTVTRSERSAYSQFTFCVPWSRRVISSMLRMSADILCACRSMTSSAA